MKHSNTIDQEYEQIFGNTKKVRLLDFSDDEYLVFKENIMRQSIILSRRLQLKLKSGNLYDKINYVSAAKKKAIHRLFQTLYDINSSRANYRTIKDYSSKIKHKSESKKKNCAVNKYVEQVYEKLNVPNSVFSLSKIINELEPIYKISSN